MTRHDTPLERNFSRRIRHEAGHAVFGVVNGWATDTLMVDTYEAGRVDMHHDWGLGSNRLTRNVCAARGIPMPPLHAALLVESVRMNVLMWLAGPAAEAKGNSEVVLWEFANNGSGFWGDDWFDSPSVGHDTDFWLAEQAAREVGKHWQDYLPEACKWTRQNHLKIRAVADAVERYVTRNEPDDDSEWKVSDEAIERAIRRRYVRRR